MQVGNSELFRELELSKLPWSYSLATSDQMHAIFQPHSPFKTFYNMA